MSSSEPFLERADVDWGVGDAGVALQDDNVLVKQRITSAIQQWWHTTTSEEWLCSRLSRRDLAVPVVLFVYSMFLSGDFFLLCEGSLGAFYALGDVFFIVSLTIVYLTPAGDLRRDVWICAMLFTSTVVYDADAGAKLSYYCVFMILTCFVIGIHCLITAFSVVLFYITIVATTGVYTVHMFNGLWPFALALVDYRCAQAVRNTSWAEQVLKNASQQHQVPSVPRHSNETSTILPISDAGLISEIDASDSASRICQRRRKERSHGSRSVPSLSSASQVTVSSWPNIMFSELGRKEKASYYETPWKSTSDTSYFSESCLSILEDLVTSSNFEHVSCCNWHDSLDQMFKLLGTMSRWRTCKDVWPQEPPKWQCGACNALQFSDEMGCWLCYSVPDNDNATLDEVSSQRSCDS